MSLAQPSAEVMSSKAAAFSIASLLNDGSKGSDRVSELHQVANQVKQAECSSLQHKASFSPHKVSHQDKNTKLDGYAIRNILETTQAKSTADQKEDLMTRSQVHGGNNSRGKLQLHQLPNCYDFVRNFDFIRNNYSFKDLPRIPHAVREIQVALQQSDLWWKFYSCGTEMVITRTGRRMFPTLSLSFFGMDPKKYYSIHVDVVPVDRYSYTFVNSTWQVNAIASEMHPSSYIQSYQADEVVHTGLYWMKNGVDFKKLRLTNRRTGVFKEGELQLSPNRKYQPRMHVIEESDDGVKISCSTYVFPETSFIAVTTYQNEELIQMKIDHNPFAKGFRDKGARRRFVPYEQRPVCQAMDNSATAL